MRTHVQGRPIAAIIEISGDAEDNLHCRAGEPGTPAFPNSWAIPPEDIGQRPQQYRLPAPHRRIGEARQFAADPGVIKARSELLNAHGDDALIILTHAGGADLIRNLPDGLFDALAQWGLSGIPSAGGGADARCIWSITQGIGSPIVLCLTPENFLSVLSFSGPCEEEVRHRLIDITQRPPAGFAIFPISLELGEAVDVDFEDLLAAGDAAASQLEDAFWTRIAPAMPDPVIRKGDPRFPRSVFKRTLTPFNPRISATENPLYHHISFEDGNLTDFASVIVAAQAIIAAAEQSRRPAETERLRQNPRALGPMKDRLSCFLTTATPRDPAFIHYDGPGKTAMKRIIDALLARYWPTGMQAVAYNTNRLSQFFYAPIEVGMSYPWHGHRSGHELIEDGARLVRWLTEEAGFSGDDANAIIEGLRAPEGA